MKPLGEQFAALQAINPGATMTGVGNLNLVCVPKFPLPTGWSKPETLIRFVVPNGYPYSAPDCFWADSDLRLANGGMPQNAQIGNVVPGQPDPNTLWFSWHVSAWNAISCTLTTYVAVIKRRFEARV